MAIIYALCCLAFAAFNDFVFKLFANNSEASTEHKSCGTFVAIVGLIEVLGLSWLINDVSDWNATIIWGFTSGFLSVISNMLLIESMRYQSAGISSTIFRLNMVLVVIGGYLLFNEPLTCLLIIGIACAALSIIAFIPPSNNNVQIAHKTAMGFTLALVACILRAIMSLSYKGAFTHGADVNGVTVITGVSWIIGGLAFALIRDRHLSFPNKNEWTIGIVSGALVCGIVFFMARMNAYGNASIVNPIAQMSFLGTFILSALFLHEQVTLKKLVAILLGCAAIICLTV